MKYSFLIIFTVPLAFSYTACSAADCKLRRLTRNSGLHRELITLVELEGINAGESKNCSCLLIENLPSGIYVDLHELKNQEAFGGPQVYSTSKIDIEKPEYVSVPHEIYVWHHFMLGAANLQELQITIPIHLRYHRPSAEQKFVHVSLRAPKLFLQCSGTNTMFRGIAGKDALALCDHTNDTNYSECEWREVDYVKDGSLEEYVVKFKVPVGNPRHLFVALGLSLAVTVGGAIYLVYYLCISHENRDIISLIKSRKPKSKIDRHLSNHRDNNETKTEIFKAKLKALFCEAGSKLGAGEKERHFVQSSRKKYK